MTPKTWQQTCRAQLSALDEAGGTPGERLASLLVLLTRREAAAVEGRLRRRASATMTRVDLERLAWVRRQLIEHGVKPSLAAHRARVLGDALIGEFVRVAGGGQPAGRLPWAELVRLLTGLS